MLHSRHYRNTRHSTVGDGECCYSDNAEFANLQANMNKQSTMFPFGCEFFALNFIELELNDHHYRSSYNSGGPCNFIGAPLSNHQWRHACWGKATSKAELKTTFALNCQVCCNTFFPNTPNHLLNAQKHSRTPDTADIPETGVNVGIIPGKCFRTPWHTSPTFCLANMDHQHQLIMMACCGDHGSHDHLQHAININ